MVAAGLVSPGIVTRILALEIFVAPLAEVLWIVTFSTHARAEGMEPVADTLRADEEVFDFLTLIVNVLLLTVFLSTSGHPNQNE